MLKVLFPLLILIAFFKGDQKDILVWDENRLLTWDDFKGKPAKRFSAASTNYDTYKNTEEIGHKTQVKVEAVFLCNKSWKRTSWISDEILEHEQKHFDIVELYARKLRRDIKALTYTSYEDVKAKTDSLYDLMDKELDVYQDKYDDETDASMDGNKQREWNKKIAEQIKALSAYKNTTFMVPYSK